MTRASGTETDLKCGDDIALNCVAVALCDVIHAEVTNEGGESHSPTDDGCVISHYSCVRFPHPNHFTETY